MQNSPAIHTPGQLTGTPGGNFAMDAFDFGSNDFTLPSNLDDLSIFTSQPPTSHAGSEGSSSAHASHHPSPSNLARSDVLPSSHLHNTHTSSPLSLNRNHFEKSASPSAGGLMPQPIDNRPRQSSSGDQQFHGYFNQPQAHGQHSITPQPHQHPQHHDQQQQQQQQQTGAMMPQLSIADLQRMLMEKERSERIQNMQTALLKQQLEQLQRMQQAHQQQGNSVVAQQSNLAPMAQNAALPNIGVELPQNQQSSFLAALQNVLGVGNQQQQRQASGRSDSIGGPQQPNQQQQWRAGSVPMTGSSSSDDPNALAQYGLMTPLGSGAFSNTSCPPGQSSFMSPLNMPVGSQPVATHPIMSQYTPVESPAVTPASVFSNASTGIVMHELFSPLTSPALGPQPPSLGEILLPPAQMSHQHQQQQHHLHQQPSSMTASPAFNAIAGNTPTASPLALMGKSSSGSKIRKNRSTTAEARANKVRPSPLIKPTQNTNGRKKKDSISGTLAANAAVGGANGTTASVPSSRRTSISETDSRNHSRHHSMEAGQSEGTSSTPSPIDLGGGSMPPPQAPLSKPMTPGSIMGIRPVESKRSSLQNLAPSPTSRQVAPAASALKGKSKAEGEAQQYTHIAPFVGGGGSGGGSQSAPKVTFNLGNANGNGNGASSATNNSSLPPILPNGGLPIQPGGLSQSEREAWMSYKSAGGLESRRTSHKAAEQKRRDSLKFCFDELRGLLPAITLDEDAPAGSLLGPDGREEDQTAERFDLADVGDAETARSANKAISKVALLRHSNEYLIRLTRRLERRDEALALCRREIGELRAQLGLNPAEEEVFTGKGTAWRNPAAVSSLSSSPKGAEQQQQGLDEGEEEVGGSHATLANMEEDSNIALQQQQQQVGIQPSGVAGMDTS